VSQVSRIKTAILWSDVRFAPSDKIEAWPTGNVWRLPDVFSVTTTAPPLTKEFTVWPDAHSCAKKLKSVRFSQWTWSSPWKCLSEILSEVPGGLSSYVARSKIYFNVFKNTMQLHFYFKTNFLTDCKYFSIARAWWSRDKALVFHIDDLEFEIDWGFTDFFSLLHLW
jgi:hypothetical protein